jgi:hypothetical protein
MSAAKDDEMIETFVLDRLHESFGECDHIGISDRSSLGFDLFIFEGIQERLGVLSPNLHLDERCPRRFRKRQVRLLSFSKLDWN